MKLAVCMLALTAFLVGRLWSDTETEYKVIHKTTTVTRTKTVTEHHAFVPDSCIQAGVRAGEIRKHAEELDTEASSIDDLVSTFVVAANTKNFNEMVSVRDGANKLLNRTLAAHTAMSEAEDAYDMYAARCAKDIKEQSSD